MSWHTTTVTPSADHLTQGTQISVLLSTWSLHASLLMQRLFNAVPSLLSHWHLPECAAGALITNALLPKQRLLVLLGQASNRIPPQHAD